MKLLATVTLNANQLRSHLLPLVALPEVEEVVLVADAPPPEIPKVRSVVPSRREQRLLGRAGSKLVHCARLARSLRPDWILSYIIMPHGVNGFLAGRLGRCRTAYHMIGGDIEWRGGGWRSENAVLGRLPRPVALVERALLGVIRRTDVICTMGTNGRAHLLSEGLDPQRVFVTPPAVDTERFSPASNGVPPAYDLVTAGRLVENKRLQDFIAIVRLLRRSNPGVRAAVAGTGPVENDLKREAERAGVADAIDFLGLRLDIEDVYRAARVFVLTSATEGLSVAMTEAMASGLPAVVTDVGDLRDLVEDGRSGHVLPVGDVAGFAARISDLLGEDARRAAFADEARRAAVEHAAVAKVSALYRRILLQPA
jgi:glycosyltransferase involved in cell wall biosynthesis